VLYKYFTMDRDEHSDSDSVVDVNENRQLGEELDQLKELLYEQQQAMRDLVQQRLAKEDDEVDAGVAVGAMGVTGQSSTTLTAHTDRGLSSKLPKLPSFGGKGKGAEEVTFDQWFYEAETLQGIVEEQTLRRAITLSLKGQAHASVRNMPPGGSVAQILAKLNSSIIR